MQRFFNLGPFYKHTLTIHRSHVIEIDVDRETRDSKDEEVQGRAAFENQFVFQKGVTADGIEQLLQKPIFSSMSGRNPVASAWAASVSEEIFTVVPPMIFRKPLREQ